MSHGPLAWRSVSAPTRHSARAFLPLLQSAVAAHPERLDLRRDLAVALRDGRRWPEIIELLSPLRRRAGPLPPELAFELGCAALALDDAATALSAFDLAIAGGDERGHRQRAYALGLLGREDEAQGAARAALRADPHDAKALELVAEYLIRHDAPGLTTLCQELAACGVQSTTFLALQAVEMALAGRHAALTALLDPERWCARIEIDQGLVDNDELADAILSHPALAPSSEEKATLGRNLRLESLAFRTVPAIQSLLAVVRQQVNAYVTQRLGAPHPVLERRPDCAILDGWALVVTEDGREAHHIHPAGWLTAVYYVRTPKAGGEGQGEGPPPGSIVFGPWPPSCDDCLPTFPRWHFTPQAGQLLIFPSFMGHHTIPTNVADTRLCVALDVMPCKPTPEVRS